MTALTAVADLEPIGLAELVERAALLTRVDRKYLLPVAAANRVVAGLAGAARVLEIDGRRASGYESLYFDTPDLAGYHLAARGRRRRFKVRRRSYADTGQVYLEVKTRGGRGSTVKARTPDVDSSASDLDDSAPDLDDAARRFVDEVLERAGIAPVGSELAPVLATAYRRTTLLLPDSESRVTVDTGLRWSLLDGPRLTLPDVAVVETKTGSTPSAADRLLWRHGHRPARVSKYGTGLAALHDSLPDTKWRRVLRRHFDPHLAAQERTAP